VRLVAADIDGDGRLDIVTMSDQQNLRWYSIPKDPRQPWQRHAPNPQAARDSSNMQAGGAAESKQRETPRIDSPAH
jgi:hypothetical protein